MDLVEKIMLMRVYTVSDIHIDYGENEKWMNNLSLSDYTDDILVLPGDITDVIPKLVRSFIRLKKVFREVLFVPGNHDLWICRDPTANDSIKKFNLIETICWDHGIRMKPFHMGPLSIVPLFGWYDYSFGNPSSYLLRSWSDFQTCKWPEGFTAKEITKYFLSKNAHARTIRNQWVISFSHFLPRIDLMPRFIPPVKKMLYPVLGTSLLDRQIQALGGQVHIYGHSHLNMTAQMGPITYINNAFGYPHEANITAKKLRCVLEKTF